MTIKDGAARGRNRYHPKPLIDSALAVVLTVYDLEVVKTQRAQGKQRQHDDLYDAQSCTDILCPIFEPQNNPALPVSYASCYGALPRIESVRLLSGVGDRTY